VRLQPNDIIAAIATPPGDGAIAIIRVSGPNALHLAKRVFSGKDDLAKAAGYTVHYGKVVNGEREPVDSCLLTVFRAPHSYTGEDSFEVSCHGGHIVTANVLDIVLQSGARLAEPGEFTKRAFLNGKLDLTQAEAVADLIAAQSTLAARASMRQLDGRLGSKVRTLKDDLIDLCGLLELELDFSEEGIPLVSREEIIRRIKNIADTLKDMVGTFRLGRLYRDGISVVLVGPPNVGKSSIFNMLLREDRAIVTPVPGTTRDALEESIQIDGVLFKLVDTAGLRQSNDIVEREGILRSHNWAKCADVILNVHDITDENDVGKEDLGASRDQIVIDISNKVDLLPTKKVAQHVESAPQHPVFLSAKTGLGFEKLRNEILGRTVGQHKVSSDTVLVADSRHVGAMELGMRSLEAALSAVESGLPSEFVAIELREAASHLSSITGESTTDDILSAVFSKFCIGK
jgi:tRNA modification GTPase